MSYATITIPFDFDLRDVPEGSSQWAYACELFLTRIKEDPSFIIKEPRLITFQDVTVQEKFVYQNSNRDRCEADHTKTNKQKEK